MCRFVLYMGPTLTLDTLLTRPIHSLVHQSYHAEERVEPLNGDGFGVAWYVPEICPEPAAFRSISPAWNNQNLIEVSRVTRSECILAHVRAASPGLPVTVTNCHPFTRAGFAFMHNGHVSGFQQVKRKLQEGLSDASFGSIQGTTDSEHLFAIFLDHHTRLASEQPQPLERMAAALLATLDQAVRLCEDAGVEGSLTMNLAVSDGQRAVVSRFGSCVGEGGSSKAPSLYLHEGKRYDLSPEGLCRMRDPEGGRGAVIVSSEPLSEDPGWERVPENHLVLLGSDHSVEIRAVLG